MPGRSCNERMLFAMDRTVERLPSPGDAGPAAAADPGPGAIRLQPTRGFSRVLSPRELWRYREVGLQVAMRDITVRYRQTLLGAAWAVLQPVATMVVFTLIFGNLAHLSSDKRAYALFSLAALVPWTFFATAVQLGSDSLVSNSALVSKIYFPRIFIPAGVLVAGLVDVSISSVVLLVIVAASGITITFHVLLLPLLILIAFAAALGVSSALSAINVRYRDVRYVVPFAVQMWLFLTPVVYSLTLLHEPLRTLAAINPMVGVVEGYRWAVLGTATSPWVLIAISAGGAVVLLLAGLAYFDRVERSFADLL
jgi:lipopolysaccharide transport system permease protein